MLIILPLLAAACLPAARLVFGRPLFLRKKPPNDQPQKVSVIVPARDEEANIGVLLDSLNQQVPPPYEVIVVDDGSTDQTTEISRAQGAKVISAPALPEGWKGKPWACHNGALAATGDHLLFLDADTWIESNGFSKLTSLTTADSGAISVCPYHRVVRPYEQLSAFFNLTMIAGINSFGAEKDNAALFGQCLLISRANYEAIEGHTTVSKQILENFHLTKILREKGIGVKSLLGRGTISMRMFPSEFADLWRGWKKGFARGAGNVSPKALALTSIWITGAMLTTTCAVISCFTFPSDTFRILSGLVYILYVFQFIRAFRYIGNFSPFTSIFFPIPLLFYQTLFFYSLIDRKLGNGTNWKGRHVD